VEQTAGDAKSEGQLTTKSILKTVALLAATLFPFSSAAEANDPLILTNGYWPPFKGESLPKGGIITDVTLQTLTRAGYEVAVAVVPWKRAYAGTVDGRYDVISAIWATPERQTELAFSDAILSSRVVVIHRSDYDFTFSSLEDLKGETVGVTAGYGYPESFQKADFFEREESQTLTQSLRKLILGRINVIVAEETSARYVVAADFPDAVGSLQYSETALQENPLHVAFTMARPDHPELRTRFNEALADMRADGTLEEILEFHGVSSMQK
jgi:polar amino acid transport system substrate-binding protein